FRSSATQHYLHVRTVCGAAFSSWTTISFTTSCVATNIPYSENFDGVTAPAIPTCITVQNVNASNTWGTYSTPAAIIIGAPNSMVYTYNSTVAADDWFYTQGLNLTAGVSYRLSFKWKSNPGFPESFEVKYGSGSNAASMTAGTLYTNASAGNSTAQTQTADFIPSASGVYYIGFHCNSAADLDFLAIDDITVDLSPSCANPTGLSALPTGTGTTADLAWVAPGLGSPTGYEWAVNASATPPASGTLTTGTTANATGLTAGSTYYLHVRTECGTGTYSSWSTILFSTVVNDEACGAIPLTLGGPASCANTTTATSIADPTLPGACSSPNNTLWYSYTPSTTGTAIVRTEIPSGSSNGLSGWLAIYTATGTCPSLTLTALAGSACQSFGPTAGDVDSLTTPVLTAGTTYYFMIDGVAGDVGDFCINIIAPPAAPTCTTNISPADGATGVVISPAPSITWNAAANATSYDVYFGTVNPPTTLIGNIAATTVQITGLQYDSTYYWYIAPRNAGGAAVGCSTSVTSFTAQSIPPDCVPLTTSGCTLSDRLELFRLKGETSELNINTGTTCSATAYTDSTDHAVIIDLARGKSYWGQMKAGATGDYLTVWLDANDNGVYEDTERLMNNFAMSTSITNFNLFIPLSTAAGNHKLRARLVWYATAPTVLTTPCGNYAYSDTKDFIVNISTSGSSYVVSSYTPAGACFVGGGDIVIDSASNNNLGYVPLVDSLNALIVQVYPQGNNLGKVSASYFINTGAVRQSSTGIYYLDRNITVTATKQPVTPYNIRLPFKNSELNALIAQPGSGVTSQFDLVVTKNDNTCLSAINTVGASAALYIPTGFGTISGDYFLDFTNVTGFSSFYFHGGSTVIPINIEYFTGTKQGNNNLLDWKVSCSNTPNVTLTLERSADSRTFSAVYALTTTASRCLQPFSYTDTRALAGINYYRIKMTESNGTTSYSSIVALLNKNKGLELVNVAPNPTRGQFKLNIISSTNQKMDVVISDVQGRIIRTKSVTLTNGLNAIDMDVMNMAAGNYQVYGISAEGKTKPIKFIKQ
ncbi:MAG: GEVED domain-containing protein, partial [Ferruginibacter sp.]